MEQSRVDDLKRQLDKQFVHLDLGRLVREPGDRLLYRFDHQVVHRVEVPPRDPIDGRGAGGLGEFVERPEDIAPARKRAPASGRPALVNVRVDSDAKASGGLLGAIGSANAVS